MADEASFDLDAAQLRADGAELVTDIEVLARKLEEALPRSATVQRRAKSLFNRDKVVESVEVRLGEGCYVLQAHGDHIHAARAVEVRGVVIRREELGLEEWMAGLTGELREQARSSAQAREALGRLLG